LLVSVKSTGFAVVYNMSVGVIQKIHLAI